MGSGTAPWPPTVAGRGRRGRLRRGTPKVGAGPISRQPGNDSALPDGFGRSWTHFRRSILALLQAVAFALQVLDVVHPAEHDPDHVGEILAVGLIACLQ